MAGDSNITAAPLSPEPTDHFVSSSQQENQPASTAPSEFAGWKVVTAGKDYRWIKCAGCGGEVGIPSDWNRSTAECPKCGLSVQVDGGILYRPPAPIQTPLPSLSPAPVPTPAHKATNSGLLEIDRSAQRALICGALSVVLGWTIIVPIMGVSLYIETSGQATKEQVPVPGKATAGLILSLLFGIVQGITMIAHLSK